MSYSIKDIEGIGKANSKKLAKAKVMTTSSLLKKAASKADRKNLAKETGCTPKQILEWANRADLMRVKGVAEEYSDLLESSGVDTAKELATRNAAALAEKFAKVNAKKKLVRSLPTEKTIKKWIASAKKLKAVLTY